jgi:hypothetical protein
MKSEQDIIDEVTRAVQEERKAQKEEKPERASTYMIQVIVDESKIPAITVVLEAMNIGYIVLQEVRP